MLSIIDKYYEIVYIILFALYFYTQVTMLSKAPFILVSFLENVVGLILPVIVIIWLVRNLFLKKWEAVIGTILAIILVVLSSLNGYDELKYLGMLAAGSIGVNLKKVIKITGVIAVATIFYTFLYSFAIDPSINTVYVEVKRIRSTMGMSYPTDAASLALFVCLGVMILGKACPTLVTHIMSLLSLLLAYFYFGSKTSAIVSAMLCMAIVGIFWCEKKANRLEMPGIIRIVAQGALYVLIPLMAAIQLLLAFFYGKEASWAVRVDDLLHKRVAMTHKGLIEHSITLLGKNIELIGTGEPGINNVDAYNYLDSSYINILVRYGLIAAVCILFIWIVIQRKAVKGRNIFIILAAVLISVHSFEEHHFTQIAYNPLLYLPFADGFDNEGNIIDVLPLVKKNANKVVVAVGIAGVIMVILPFAFSTTRTIFDSMEYENVSERLEADSKAVQLILDTNECPVYADVLTEKYVGKFKGIKQTICSGDDLVRKLDCTIITDIDVNSWDLFSKGAVYARISEYSAVYTTDHSVITALQNAGYHVAAYFYQEKQLDVSYVYNSDSISVSAGHVDVMGEIGVDTSKPLTGDVAKVTILSVDGEVSKIYGNEDVSEDGVIRYDIEFDTEQDAVTLQIESLGETEIIPRPALLTQGIKEYQVDINLRRIQSTNNKVYKGSYTLNAQMMITNYKNIYDDVAVRIIFMPSDGTESSKDVYLRDFREDGTLDYETVFDSRGDNYTIIVEPSSDVNLKVGSMSITNTPSYDIHSTYNSDGRVARSEYYDLNGNKVLTPEGVFAYEFDYDKKGNAIVIRYYDTDNSPVTSLNGYAEVHRKFDKLNHMIYESYYGEDGMPLTNQSGFAAYSLDVDVWGRPLCVRYYNSEGKPVIISVGYSAIRYEFNDKDQIVYEAYYDENDNRLELEAGYSGCRFEYDDAGHQTRITYLDDNDNPTIISSGYAGIERQYDEKGNMVVESYYDTEGNLMLLEQGYAAIVQSYDDFGDNISTMYFGLDTSEGYIEIRREYDDQRRLIYEGKFNSDGEPLIMDGEYSAYRIEYDDAGNVISVQYYGIDGNLIDG